MKNSLFVRGFSLLLLLVLMYGMTAVAYASEEGTMTISELMEKFDSSVQRPKASSILDEPEEMYVRSQYGSLIYVCSRPAKSGKKIAEAREGEKVTVYARQGGYALGIVNKTGVGGWMKLSQLSYGVPRPTPPIQIPENITPPARNEYLDEYETMFVKTKYGVRICIYADPTQSAKGKNLLGYAYEREECTVMARRGGYSFVFTESGEIGWVMSKLLVYEYD